MNAIKPKKLSHWLNIYKLYHRSFPASEKKPFVLILSTYRKGITDVWYFEQADRFAGLAITINSDSAILLDYFAISPKLRNQGIGSQILCYLQKYYHPKGLLLEIECLSPDAPNLEERTRRKNFYLANNMTPLNIMVNLFGVEMELLGYNCQMDFPTYHSFYSNTYGNTFAKNVKPID